MIIGKEIPKNHLKYYLGKEIFVKWCHKAFMQDYIALCNVISENEFVDVSNDIKYDISNSLIEKIYFAEKGLQVVNTQNVNEQSKLNYIVIVNYKCNETYFNFVAKFFSFKKIESSDDLEQFKQSFIDSLKNENPNSNISCVGFVNINTLN